MFERSILHLSYLLGYMQSNMGYTFREAAFGPGRAKSSIQEGEGCIIHLSWDRKPNVLTQNAVCENIMFSIGTWYFVRVNLLYRLLNLANVLLIHFYLSMYLRSVNFYWRTVYLFIYLCMLSKGFTWLNAPHGPSAFPCFIICAFF